MSCSGFEGLISGHADGVLSPRQEASLLEHLSGCHSCAARLARYRQMDVLLRRLPQREAPPALRQRVLAGLESRRAVWQGFSWRMVGAAASVFLLAAALSAAGKPSDFFGVVRGLVERDGAVGAAGPGQEAAQEAAAALQDDQVVTVDQAATGASSDDNAVLLQVRRTIVRPDFRPMLPAYLPRGTRLATVNFGRGYPGGPIDRLDVAFAAGGDHLNLRQSRGRPAAVEQDHPLRPPLPPRKVNLAGQEWLLVRRVEADSGPVFTLVGERGGMTIWLESSLPVHELERVAASLRD